MTLSLNRRQVLTAAAAAAAGASAPLSALAQSSQVVIYTSNNAQAFDTVTEVARKQMPGVKLSAITGGSGQLLRRLEAEAAKPQGDVFWSSSANTLGAFSALYESYRSPQLAAIPQALHHPGGLWSAANVHVVVAMTNRKQLGNLAMPKTWVDLLDPGFKGKIIIADPANSSTAYTILWGIEKMLGADGLKRLAANLKVTSSASTVLRSVAQGEFTVGLTFEANAYSYVAGGQKEIALLYPSDGTFTTAEYLTLIKGAPAGDLAKKACDLLLSKEAQTELLLSAYRRPARSDINVSKLVELPEMSSIKVFNVDEAEAAAKRADFLKRWQAMATAS